MKKSFRVLVTVLLVVVFVLLLIGCGSSNGGNQGNGSNQGNAGNNGSTTPAGDSKNTIPWNGVFAGVELPKVGNHDKVYDYNTKSDCITVRIDGVTYEEFKEYCRILENLAGWQRDDDENVANFPSDYNSKDKVYFSGAYQSLPHISVQYYSDSKVESTGYPHFVMFVYTEW